MAWNDELEPDTPAYGIAASDHRRIRVLAGPGAGKSFAMKRRVARLLEVDNVNPTRILPVTLTRVAAEDLHRELVSLGVQGANQLHGRTLHSLAMSLLMRNHVLAVLGRVPRPLNGFELEPLLADLSPKHGNKYARKDLILAYGAAWARLQIEEPGFTRTPAEQLFVDELVDWLRFHNAMLVDEIIPHLYRYLADNPGAQERGEFDHLLVDEYQDLNRADQEVLHFLGENGSICAIGDDDQSIYSFRHAHPDGIRYYSARLETQEHQIAECRRCPTTVVRMANRLIARNRGRDANRSMAERAANGAGLVCVRQYPTADAEADAVAAKIATLVAGGVPPGEIIVLAQRATFANPVFHRLHDRGVPVKSYYAESELDTIEAQERIAVLKLLLDNEDRVALRWLLGCRSDDWRTKQYSRIIGHIRENGGSPWGAMSALADGELKIKHTNQLVDRFNEITVELNRLNAAPDLNQFIQEWLPPDEKTKLLSELVAECREGAEAPRELFNALYDAITQPEIPLEVAEVRIMSLHKSKGLSSPFVFIVGCVEGLLPGRPDMDATQEQRDAKLEEDRRLFYVGITRVKSNLPARPGYLALTHAQTMPTAEAYKSQINPVRIYRGIAILQPSRFLGEMAPALPAAEFNAPL